MKATTNPATCGGGLDDRKADAAKLRKTAAASELPREIFASYPVVYAVGDEYQIQVSVKQDTLMWCEVNGNEYFDDSCGILRSDTSTHRMTVPMGELDSAGCYTIRYRKMVERLPYFSRTDDVGEIAFPFRPVSDKKTIRLYHIADAHNRVAAPIAAAKFFPEGLDLLILNGDIPDHSGDIGNLAAIHIIAGEITRGEIPTVFSRGNHDMRGVCAEHFAEHTPTDRGNSYFTFRLGPLWGIVLDCGEDKPDTNPEYGNTIACHAFRRRETRFLRQVIANAASEYQAPGVRYRLVISHMPFSYVGKPPFDIEQDLYREWCRLLKEHVKPDLMISGHIHDLYVTRAGEALDHLGQPCPVVVGARPGQSEAEYAGAAIALSRGNAEIWFTDQERKILGQDHLTLTSR